MSHNTALSNKINNYHLLAISIGIVYLWFGTLKFFPGISPAEGLAADTIRILTFDLIPDNISVKILALWETIIGVLLIHFRFKKVALSLALVHIILTFSPLLVLPELCFGNSPMQLTLIGQYIIKNIVFLLILVILYKNRAN